MDIVFIKDQIVLKVIPHINSEPYNFLRIEEKVTFDKKTYFIADIESNFDTQEKFIKLF